jgi:hypothetical protein
MKPPLRNTRIFTKPEAASRVSFALMACLALLLQPLHQSVQAASSQENPMKHYVLLFHTSSSRTLTPEEQEQRQDQIADWAKRVTNMGIQLDPRALGETAANFSADGEKILPHAGSSDPTLSNLVFFDAPTKQQAVSIAHMHPGLRFGSTVEVREWTDPRQSAAKP